MPFNPDSFVEIMDTTLRDGEQTEEVCFSPGEKLSIAKKLLLDVKVDRVEIASARGSQGERASCREIFLWAQKNGFIDRVEVLGFVDFDLSVDWIGSLGGRVINLLCKGSKRHCVTQLKKSPAEHFEDIRKTIAYAKSKNFAVNAYLEDFSNGMMQDEEYVFELIKVLFECGVKRVLLADTLGVLSPEQTRKFVQRVVSLFPGKHFDFHAHNDYDFAVANSVEAVQMGCMGIHVTVNGLGERAGNAALEVAVPAINDFSGKKTLVDEKQLLSVSRLVELFSKRRIAKNHPIAGQVVFTQTAGIHADGDKKGNLYKTRLSAGRFGRGTRYTLGKLSGKASVELALKQLEISLSKEELALVLKKVIELGDKKEFVSKEDLLFIVNEMQSTELQRDFRVLDYRIVSSKKAKPSAEISVSFMGEEFSANAKGDGGYNAFMNALKKIFDRKKFSFPQLIDYEVRIPVGGQTDALVEAKTIWKKGNRRIETIGVSTDQVEAAIKATEKMVNVALLIGKD